METRRRIWGNSNHHSNLIPPGNETHIHNSIRGISRQSLVSFISHARISQSCVCAPFHYQVWNFFGNETSLVHGGSHGCFWHLPFISFWADIFWRAVDASAVNFARWIEEKCVYRDGEKKERIGS
jgi:hypothetical protein